MTTYDNATERDMMVHKFQCALEYFYAQAKNSLRMGRYEELKETFKIDDKMFTIGIWEGSDAADRIKEAFVPTFKYKKGVAKPSKTV